MWTPCRGRTGSGRPGWGPWRQSAGCAYEVGLAGRREGDKEERGLRRVSIVLFPGSQAPWTAFDCAQGSDTVSSVPPTTPSASSAGLHRPPLVLALLDFRKSTVYLLRRRFDLESMLRSCLGASNVQRRASEEPSVEAGSRFKTGVAGFLDEDGGFIRRANSSRIYRCDALRQTATRTSSVHALIFNLYRS